MDATGEGTLLQWRYQERYYQGTTGTRGSKFLLCVHPPGHHAGKKEWSQGRVMRGFRPDTVYTSAVFDSLQSAADLLHLRFLNMTGIFRERSDGTLYYSVDPHWTSRGHAVAADTLSAFLLSSGLLPSGRGAGQ
jgi:hypothetical protein